MMRRLSLVLAFASLTLPREAAADSCAPLTSVFLPGGPCYYGGCDPLVVADPVGRGCTVQLATPAASASSTRIDAKTLSLEAGGSTIDFDLAGPTAATGKRELGCGDPGDPRNTWSDVAYELWTLTPRQPLPASTEISVVDASSKQTLVRFKTSEATDNQGCSSKIGPPASPGVCSPGVQICNRHDGGTGASSDSGVSGGTPGSGCTVGPAGAAPASAAPVLLLVVGLLVLLRRS
jgi:MYXO-CTERM domain-containing protein